MANSICGVGSPHLYLNFDINGTLIAVDANNDNKQNHDVVCGFIADKYKWTWDPSISTPISYCEYVKYYLCPNPENLLSVKTQQKELFSDTLKAFEAMNFPQVKEAQEDYEAAMAAVKAQESPVFRSFFKLMEYLQTRQKSFTLLLRTFGPDGPKVAQIVAKHIEIKEFHTIKKGVFQIEGKEENLYQYIKAFSERPGQHLAIREDHTWWFEHGETSSYGKAFPVDLKDRRCLSIFFDDNARVSEVRPERNIVRPYDAESGEPLSVPDLIEQRRIFPVDTVRAICEEDYYIDLVKTARRFFKSGQ